MMQFTKTISIMSILVILLGSTMAIFPMVNALTKNTFDDSHTTARFGNSVVCGDHICIPGEHQKMMDAMMQAQHAKFVTPRTSMSSPSLLMSNKNINQDVFNKPGNILISDQFNNRVIEVNPVTKNIVWSFGFGNPSLCNPGPGAIIGTNDAERLSNGLTLIAGTGLPAGASSYMSKGCVDNRVIVVNQAGQIVWQYGQVGITGSDPNMLNAPVFAIQLPNHNFLITDQGNNRIIEVNKTKQIVWSYGPTSGSGALSSPNSAELLPNGNLLIADQNNNRAIEITHDSNIVWQYNTGLQAVAFASRLPDGHTLIVDSGHSRIVEINEQKSIVFQYFTNTTSGSNSSPTPSNAVRLVNGETSIADQFNDRAIIIDSKGNTVFQYGMTNMTGVGTNQLNAPYSAFVIGDYTGQTPPPP
ncbi:MAG: NHL repeat-containing protein [Nitrosotalea sp.]